MTVNNYYSKQRERKNSFKISLTVHCTRICIKQYHLREIEDNHDEAFNMTHSAI